MTAAEYIVQFFIGKGITDAFGYPGGMVTPLMDAFRRDAARIRAHVTYHEQGAAFAACGYAQASGKPGVAYATSGPGATNLITGICNAYFDSIPCLFITGQVNTNESKRGFPIRQRGFQETEIVRLVRPVTKYAAYVGRAGNIRSQLEKAYYLAMDGRPGPVLLDIPMNVLLSETDPEKMRPYVPASQSGGYDDPSAAFEQALNGAARPVLLFGCGIKTAGVQELAWEAAKKLNIPVVTSMVGIDATGDYGGNQGFIGAYGSRTANFTVAKCDLLLSFGSRLDIRQVGAIRENFAPHARIIRVDIDRSEFAYKLRSDETQIFCSLEKALSALKNVRIGRDFSDWRRVCRCLSEELRETDVRTPNRLMEQISAAAPEQTIITTDVGQNQVWAAQSFRIKKGQKILFSGGLGAMGYALPAAIGAYYGGNRPLVYCLAGDGGFQMNIQELQFIARERLPVKMFVLNNNALGMIRHFQEMYFQGRYFQTKPEGGYTAPNFAEIARAYGIRAQQVADMGELEDPAILTDSLPALIEIRIREDTYVFPKLAFGEQNQDQEPLLDREKYERLMAL